MKILTHFHGGDELWHKARNGLITMSRAKDLLTKGKGVTRASYLQEVAAERLSSIEFDGYYGRDMIRGNELEPFALRAVLAHTGIDFSPVGFVIHDDERIGCSPDALSEDYGLEIKCPLPKQHIKYMDLDIVMREHNPQMQGGMWVCQKKHWYFASFCPWVTAAPLIVHSIDKDWDLIRDLAKSAIDGADEVDAMVSNVNTRYPHKSVSDIAEEAREYWEAFTTEMSGEVQIDG
jgi:hypothetical protein